MKKLIILTAVMIFFAAGARGQWTMHTTPTTQSLNKIFVLNSSTIFAVGTNQVILKTTNGGAQWIKLRETADYELNGVYFQNELTGIAAGGSYYNNGTMKGIILKTTNGGTTWDSTIINNNCIRTLFFVNSNTGYAGGWAYYLPSPLLKTTNFGVNWTAISNIPGLAAVTGISFINENTGWAAGDSSIGGAHQGVIKTTDGGTSWFSTAYFGNIINCQIYTAAFINENTGWLGGVMFSPVWGGMILKTTNGGINWVQQANHCYNELYDIFFIDENTGWAGSDGPMMQKTTNGGVNWNVQSIQQTSWIHSVKFSDANVGWCVGTDGYIFSTLNGGGTISVQNISTEVPSTYLLEQNYPNPFNPSTKIRYSIPKSGFVKLEIFDALGREVETLVNQTQTSGTYEASFAGENYPSGVYFYKLSSGDFQSIKKMVLVK